MAEMEEGAEGFVTEEGAAQSDMSTLLLAVSLLCIIIGIGLVYTELTQVYGWKLGG